MSVKTYQRNIFQRILGKPMTKAPADAECWHYIAGELVIDLARAPELAEPWGAVNLEGATLPHPVLVMRDGEGMYRAFCNKCGHSGRRLDPVPGADTLCCCSMGKSTFNYAGEVVEGPATSKVMTYPVEQMNGKLIVYV